MATALSDSGTMKNLPSTLLPSIDTCDALGSLPSSFELISRNSLARASLPRLSFGAMNRSGPLPLAASSSYFLNRSSNLTSWIVSLRSGLAALMRSVTAFSAQASVPAPDPYECHTVRLPLRPAEAAVPAGGAGQVGVAVAAAPPGADDAPPVQAMAAMATPEMRAATRSWYFMKRSSSKCQR